MLILITILGHLIADYPLQTDKLLDKKKESTTGVFQHVLRHLITYLILIWLFSKINVIEINLLIIYYIFLICIFHLIIDLVKEKLNRHVEQSNDPDKYKESIKLTFIYIIDQLIHFACIFYFAHLMFDEYKFNKKELLQKLNSLKDIDIDINTKILLTLIVILINTYFSGYLIGFILKPFKPSNKVIETHIEGKFMSNNVELCYEDFNESDVETKLNAYVSKAEDDIKLNKKISFIHDSPAKAGKWIGFLERNLILILCITNNLSSIGFLIAMKALTRFKQFDDKSFAEYYLIGTMLSIIFGLIAGFILRFLW